MSLRILTSLFAVICLMVIFATTPVARAYVQGSDVLVTRDPHAGAVSNSPTEVATWDKSRTRPPERPWQSRRHDYVPVDGDASAPIPEPGTFTLASLGLLALGAAMRKRRGAQAPAGIR